MAGAGLMAARLAAADEKAASPTGPWAVELFTSQGCSSCPPADLKLGELARRADIVALSFHVDYWDYIGWKDRFATPATTERQRVYARTLKQRYVYTPEMVVDGRVHEPGVSDSQIERMLDEARRRTTVRATPVLEYQADGSVRIALAAAKLESPADITLFIYDRRHTTPIARGENNGRRIENFNVVRHFETIDRWNGAAHTWTVPAGRFQPEQGIAVLVQAPDQGPVIGAGKFEPMVAG